MSPQIIIGNTCEPFIQFFQRAGATESHALIQAFLQASERAMYWAGQTGDRPHPKFVITSTPIAHFAAMQARLGYADTTWATPNTSSFTLCHDILQTPELMATLSRWGRAATHLDLIPYATTPEFLDLVQALRQQGVPVSLPESVDTAGLDLRRYLATKVGCRGVLTQVLGAQALPEGYLAPTLADAVAIAQYFLARQQPFLVKPNDGCLGIGQTRFVGRPLPELAQVRSHLQQNPFLRDNLLVVEAFIATEQPRSPSIEVCIPRTGTPEILLVCVQQFSTAGRYVGEVVSRTWAQEPWYPPLTEAALAIAHRLQAMGYVGHFDLDSLIDPAGQPRLIEFNPRRTGGSHLHDLGTHLFGPDYGEHVALLSRTGLPIPPFESVETGLTQLAPWLYPIDGHPQGIVVTHSSGMTQGTLGYVAIAPDLEAVLALNQRFIRALTP